MSIAIHFRSVLVTINMCKRIEEASATPVNPGDTYVFGLRRIAEDRGITIDEAAEQIVVELRKGFSEEHIEPTLQALAWIKANAGSIE